MKRILLSTAAIVLMLTTACTSTPTEETNINATDTINTLPPADNTGPGIEGANPDMVNPESVDRNGASGSSNSNSGNSSGAINSGSGASTSGGNSASINSSTDNRGSSSRGAQEVMVPPAPPKDNIKSTYKRAAPGDTVDSRTNMGSSR